MLNRLPLAGIELTEKFFSLSHELRSRFRKENQLKIKS